jgi:hypothetical protein
MANQIVEIHISKRTEADSYAVELSLPGWRNFPRRQMSLDLTELHAHGANVSAYGLFLGQTLFADTALGHDYREALAAIRGQDKDLTVRLRLDDPELHEIRWERLHHPLRGKWRPIAITAATPFSRYILAEEWKRPRPIAERPLRVLVIIASPEDLATYGLSPIDEAERQQVHAIFDGLTDIQLTYLETDTVQLPTLENISRELMSGHHFVHFVCHGAKTARGPVLYLETEVGKVDAVPAHQLTSNFSALRRPPQFCFLAACESAAQSRSDGFVPLGPQLIADGGVTAVVAMSEQVTVATAMTFTEQFYSRLLQHGQVDLAVNEARALVQDRWDWSVPVLFSRLPDNQLLSLPGVVTVDNTQSSEAAMPQTSREEGQTELRESLPPVSAPTTVQPTPIQSEYYLADASTIPSHHLDSLKRARNRRMLALFIGADLPGEVTGVPSRAELAHDLARHYRLDEHLPLSEVAELVGQGRNRFEFTQFLVDAFPSGQQPTPFYQNVATLVKKYQLETIMTTCYDDSLRQAFYQANLRYTSVVREGDERYITPEIPTLIELYGNLQQKDTLVITASDHATLSRNKRALIDEVHSAFRRNTVLILGYNLADSDFYSLLTEIRETRHARQIFAVWPGLPEQQVKMWEGRGIIILAGDPLSALLEQIPPPPLPSETATENLTEAQLRELLEKLGDEALTVLCFDHFTPVYRTFNNDTSRRRKIRNLAKYCIEQRQAAKLVSLLEGT